MTIASKTRAVVSRLPDFYSVEEVGSLFVQFVDIFGQTLEQVEADILRVMRSHWVDTANNEGSQGFDRVQKGDLDKIFAFYLENLGGTSQLKQFDWNFVEQDFIDLTGLVEKLRRAADPVSKYLKEQFSTETKRLLEAYQFAQGSITLKRDDSQGELLVPAKTRLTLTRQVGPDQIERKQFETTEAIIFRHRVNAVSTTVKALVRGGVYEVTTTGSQSWQVESGDKKLAGLMAENRQPLLVQTKTLRQALVGELNLILQKSLYTPARFVGVMLSEEIQTLIEAKPQQGRALARLNYSLLEAAYPNEIRKSYAAYRERLKGVIDVLEGGASTVTGITDIVAVNLGIIGDSEAVREARQKIRVVEFLPQPIEIKEQGVVGKGLLLREPFEIENPNPIEVIPEIRLYMHPDLFRPLINPRLVNLATGKFVQYNGIVSRNDILTFYPDGTAALNRRVISTQELAGKMPILSPGQSVWRFEASAGLAEGHFDRTRFNTSAFEQTRLDEYAVIGWEQADFDLDRSRFDETKARFDEGFFLDLDLVIARVDIRFNLLTSGAFSIRIPWDIPGFTDKFAEFDDHPRHQIRYIIEKVKAAGIFVGVAYEKLFAETHELGERLQIEARQFRSEEHPIVETDFKRELRHTPEALEGGIRHEISEGLVTSGILDHTRFDQSVFWRYKPGLFDETRFDRGDFWSQPGVFDETVFDRVDFGAGPGVFDRTQFDKSGFDPEPGYFGQATFGRTAFLAEPGRFDTDHFGQAGFDTANKT
jgi:hypothetical protein